MVRLQSYFRAVASLLLASMALVECAAAQSPRFLADDPIVRVPEVPLLYQTKPQEIDDLYDFAINSAHYKVPPPTPSLGTNTLGEVPDSSWYINRDLHRMTRAELQRGSRTSDGPVPPFTVVAAKTEGVSPGFRMHDGHGRLFFVKADPPSNPEMATASDVVGALFFHALGYNTPENYILVANPEQFQLSPKASITEASGKKYPMREKDWRKVLNLIPRMPDGQIRVMASLAINGKLMGPHLYQGVRSDDPNDLIPHQQRRDQRGLAVFAAWLNHTDAKAANSMDAVEGSGSDARMVHYLLDFGALFGSDSTIAKDPRHGREFTFPTSRAQLKQVSTFGLDFPDWQTVHYPSELKGAGNLTAEAFDPLEWKENYPNPAFRAMLPADAYWAAKKVMLFTDDDIRAIVEQGQFTDPEVVDYITRTLIARRDAVGRAWFQHVLPLEEARIENDELHFENLSVRYGFAKAPAYRYEWFSLDNRTGGKKGVPGSSSTMVPSELINGAKGGYFGCTITGEGQGDLSTTAYFHEENGASRLVGIDRKTNPPSLP
jgi:hypothetical protein